MSFSTEIKSFGTGTVLKIQQARRGACIKLFSAVIMDTPVLTGRLRANWLFAEGEPRLEQLVREDKSGAVPIAEAIKGVGASTGDKPVFLSNSLPYAARIEFDGYSAKAPEGMMRKNVIRFDSIIKVEAAK